MPNDPYLPSSPPHLGIFVVDGDANVHSDNFTGNDPAGDDLNGMFGAGEYFQEQVWWFDVFSANLGCNTGSEECTIQVNGFRYDAKNDSATIQVSQTFHIPPCPALKNCILTPVDFGNDFHDLTGVQIIATVPSSPDPITWYIDDLELNWSNNTCAAAEERDKESSII